jgi:hypothetical protein
MALPEDDLYVMKATVALRSTNRDQHDQDRRLTIPGRRERFKMSTLIRTTLALALLGSAAFLSTPSAAVEPDVDSSAGPELPAPRNRLDFQTDDQVGASKLVPQVERAAPEIIIPAPAPPPPY